MSTGTGTGTPIVPAPSGLVTLEQIKAFLSIPHSDDDAFLALADEIVTAEIEGATGCNFTALVEKVRRIDGGHLALILPDLPSVEVSTIEDKTSGAFTDPEDTSLDTATGLLYLESGALWAAGARRWEVTYDAGYAAVPADVQGAALTLIAARYERRDLSQTSTAQGGIQSAYGDAWSADVERVIGRYRDRTV